MNRPGLSKLFLELRPLILLVAAVWTLRIILGEGGAPALLVRLLSVTGIVPVAIMLAAMLIHFRGLGGYSEVAVASFCLAAVGQLLICAAIVFSVATGFINVYSQPEFSFPGTDPYHFLHISSHLVSIPLLGILGWGMGSLILWLLRRLVPEGAQ